MDEQKWKVDGRCVYKLVWNGTYRKREAQSENAFTIQVHRGFGTTDAGAAALAQQIAAGLNAEEDQLYKLKNLLGRFRDYAATLNGASHHNPLWVEVANTLAEKED